MFPKHFDVKKHDFTIIGKLNDLVWAEADIDHFIFTTVNDETLQLNITKNYYGSGTSLGKKGFICNANYRHYSVIPDDIVHMHILQFFIKRNNSDELIPITDKLQIAYNTMIKEYPFHIGVDIDNNHNVIYPFNVAKQQDLKFIYAVSHRNRFSVLNDDDTYTMPVELASACICIKANVFEQLMITPEQLSVNSA